MHELQLRPTFSYRKDECLVLIGWPTILVIENLCCHRDVGSCCGLQIRLLLPPINSQYAWETMTSGQCICPSGEHLNKILSTNVWHHKGVSKWAGELLYSKANLLQSRLSLRPQNKMWSMVYKIYNKWQNICSTYKIGQSIDIIWYAKYVYT